MRISAHFVRLCSQIYVAPVLLPLGQRISFSLLRRTWQEEKRLKMRRLIRELLVIAMLGVVSVSAFAQKKDDKRPPKEPEKVITKDQKNQRPPKNDQKPPKQGNRNRPD